MMQTEDSRRWKVTVGSAWINENNLERRGKKSNSGKSKTASKVNLFFSILNQKSERKELNHETDQQYDREDN